MLHCRNVQLPEAKTALGGKSDQTNVRASKLATLEALEMLAPRSGNSRVGRDAHGDT